MPRIEPPLDAHVAAPSRRYIVFHDGDRSYLMEYGAGGTHRVPGDWPAGYWAMLVDVTTPDGTRTYLHLTRMSRFWLTYGHFLWSALYELRGETLVKIAPLDPVGIGQVQARDPLPQVYVDARGDLYLLDPDQRINVVRDGRLIARSAPPTVPATTPGRRPPFLFMFSDGDDRMLALVRPNANGFLPTDVARNIIATFKVELP